MTVSDPQRGPAPSALALLPLLLFLALFFGSGLYFSLKGQDMAFYQLRAPLAALVAIGAALLLARLRREDGLATLLAGMGERNIMLMLLVFLLAGAFAELSRSIGAVDAVVNLALGALPPGLIVPGLFLGAALVSFAIGTSMGTLAATVPVGLGLADALGLERTLVAAALVGGAMFGDNLSLISDTTIAATRTQGAELRDKLRANAAIALPAALLTALWLGLAHAAPAAALPEPAAASAWLLLPYVLVLALALAGVNVLAVLGGGVLAALLVGVFFAPAFTWTGASAALWTGMEGMTEILLLALLIGGLGALMQAGGGLAWLLCAVERLARGGRGRRSGELSLAGLALGADVLTANNTVAIVAIGPLARQVAANHGITAARAAGLIDVFACVAQGLLPYGAQILLAAALASVSPLALAGGIVYCWLLGGLAVLSILWPKRRLPAAR